MQTGNFIAPSSNQDYFNIGWDVVTNDVNYSTIVKLLMVIKNIED